MTIRGMFRPQLERQIMADYKVTIGDFMGMSQQFDLTGFESKQKALAHAKHLVRIGECVLKIEVTSIPHLRKMLKFTSWRVAEYLWARQRGLGVSESLEIARREK